MPRSGGYCAQSKPLKRARPRTQGPEPSAARLAPRAFSTGVVDSLGQGFHPLRGLHCRSIRSMCVCWGQSWLHSPGVSSILLLSYAASCRLGHKVDWPTALHCVSRPRRKSQIRLWPCGRRRAHRPAQVIYRRNGHSYPM
jgi:hypothetical protein